MKTSRSDASYTSYTSYLSELQKEDPVEDRYHITSSANSLSTVTYLYRQTDTSFIPEGNSPEEQLGSHFILNLNQDIETLYTIVYYSIVLHYI